MQWTVEQIARTLGVRTPAGLDPLARVAGVSIDSRTIGVGELFIVIRGPRFDGHAFVAQSLAAGALAAVVQRDRVADFPIEIAMRLFAVADTLQALQLLARDSLRKWRATSSDRKLAAITGSAGKTTTKEILAALLGSRMRVLKSDGNLNNEYGLPLTLVRLDAGDQAAVVEMGMSRKGELARLAGLAEPEIGIVTCVAPVHLEFFDSVDEIAEAKRELVEGLAGDAPVAVLNADDARVAEFGAGFRGRVSTFGVHSRADFCAENITACGLAGSEWECVSSAGRARISLPLPGRHNIYNSLAALAAASEWGITPADAAPVLGNFRPAHMRGELSKFAAGFTVVNDAYNSNPAALTQVIEAAAGTPGYRRRLIAAGEMRELGPSSAELHRQCGEAAARSGNLDWIFGVAGEAMEILRGARKAGFRADRTRFFASSSEAADFLAGFVQPGDLLVVKGSRGVQMEVIIEALAAHYPGYETRDGESGSSGTGGDETGHRESGGGGRAEWRSTNPAKGSAS
jgi:UDP-N-acetylmuramoyl-tripeptide--D-alanyl-D-alanine ligase